ncbi:hypothetical protein NQT62_13345 [Limnobacter humi]|uniref:AttH domain-containing protein n=1 Tax=Limnobacter humi TaxID=1778671 RepID=A0ABT1WIS1_9BURK|nr:hypothetical protein [Limnobacter humi]MCQ8897421.1 hypothetical protein [Limnobacter humi]
MRRLTILTAIVGLVGLLYTLATHGLAVPRGLWAHHLAALQQQFPNRNTQIDRVVLAFGRHPQLILSGLSQHNVRTGEQLRVAVVRLELEDYGFLQGEAPRVTSITVKGLDSLVNTPGDCLSSLRTCMPTIPLEWVNYWHQADQTRLGNWPKPVLNIQQLRIDKAQWHASGKSMAQAQLDDFRYNTGSSNEPETLALAWRFSANNGTKAYVALQASPARYESADGTVAWSLRNLHTEFNGQWQGFPWTGTLAQEQLLLSAAQAGEHNTGAPIVRLSGQKLRFYLRRDDDPDTHQAAFSAGDFSGGLPLQRWSFRQAEWTFTHQDAQAWTFNLQFNPATQRLQVEPVAIEGSEGLPAPAHVRGPDCSQLAFAKSMRPDSAAIWQWQQSWFHVEDVGEGPASTAAAHSDGLRLCLQPTL